MEDHGDTDGRNPAFLSPRSSETGNHRRGPSPGPVPLPSSLQSRGKGQEVSVGVNTSQGATALAVSNLKPDPQDSLSRAEEAGASVEGRDADSGQHEERAKSLLLWKESILRADSSILAFYFPILLGNWPNHFSNEEAGSRLRMEDKHRLFL